MRRFSVGYTMQVECPTCGTHLAEDRLGSHTGGRQCVAAAAERKWRALDYEVLYGGPTNFSSVWRAALESSQEALETTKPFLRRDGTLSEKQLWLPPWMWRSLRTLERASEVDCKEVGLPLRITQRLRQALLQALVRDRRRQAAFLVLHQTDELEALRYLQELLNADGALGLVLGK